MDGLKDPIKPKKKLWDILAGLRSAVLWALSPLILLLTVLVDLIPFVLISGLILYLLASIWRAL